MARKVQIPYNFGKNGKMDVTKLKSANIHAWWLVLCRKNFFLFFL